MAKFDPIKFLTCEKSIAAYIQDALDDEGTVDPDYMTTAILAHAINQLTEKTENF